MEYNTHTKIIHTADIQLGAQFKSIGRKANIQRDQLKKTFHSVLEFAVNEDFSLIVVSGDLFDSNHPSLELVNFIKGEFDYLRQNNKEICIVPGHHDCLDSQSIYNRERFDDEFENVFIFRNPAGEVKEYNAFNIAVFAKPNTSSTSTGTPLPDFLRLNSEMKYKIVAAHGDLQIPGKSADNYHPILISELEKFENINYVALGHWHSFKGCSNFGNFKMPVFYSGSPELVDIDQEGAGNIIKVEFFDDKIDVLPYAIGKRKSRAISLDVSLFESADSLQKKISENKDSDTVLKVNLVGFNSNNVLIDTELMESALLDEFFHIQITNKSHVAIENLPEYSDKLIQGQFVKIMSKKISESSEEEKKLYETALQIGLAELEGKEII